MGNQTYGIVHWSKFSEHVSLCLLLFFKGRYNYKLLCLNPDSHVNLVLLSICFAYGNPLPKSTILEFYLRRLNNNSTFWNRTVDSSFKFLTLSEVSYAVTRSSIYVSFPILLIGCSYSCWLFSLHLT